MPIYSSDSDDNQHPPPHPQSSSVVRSSYSQPMRLFRMQGSVHSMLGGRRVADILLWRDKTTSAKILAGFTIVWLLFEVVELHFITLACYILLGLMLTLFAWNFAADFIRRRPPSIYDVQISDYKARYITGKINKFLTKLYQISSGHDMAYFVGAIAFLWVLSVIGSYTSALNLAYMSYLCMATIPVLYERYEREVEYLATQGNRDMRRLYKKIDSRLLSKIPRGPVKEKKVKWSQ